MTALKGRDRLQYIWDYLRWPILIVVCTCMAVGSLASHYLNRQDPLLNVIFINSTPENMADEGFDDFFREYGYVPYEGCVSSTMFTLETENVYYYEDFMALMAVMSGDQDIFMGNGPAFEQIAGEGNLTDLSSVLSPELLEE